MLQAQGDKQDLILRADALLESGKLQDARMLYERITQLDPMDVESWLMRIAIEAELGTVEPALACCEQVLRLDPENAEAYSMQGRLLASQGKLDLAQAALSRAVRLDAGDGEAWNTLGGVFLKQGLFADAERCGREGVRALPQLADAYVNLGNALAGLGRFDEARQSCAHAVALDDRNGLAWGCLALAWEREENWPEAKRAYLKMTERLPGQVAAMAGLARVHVALGEWTEAGQILARALTAYPGDSEIHRMLGRLYSEKGELQQAEHHYRQSVQLNSANVSARVDLGNLLQAGQRFSEAESCYTQALAIACQSPEAHFNLGVCKQRQGQYDAARACFDRAIECRPDFVEAHWYQSFICLLTGDYARGWDEYAWRLRQKMNIPRPFSEPVWDGSSLAGRTILVHDEQGYGDTFQFVRYLSLVKAKGGRVVFECHPKLGPILSGCAGYDEIHERISPGSAPNTVFDTQIHLLSLPQIFQTRLESIPADGPYLKANPERVAYWRDRIAGDTGFKIGIAWAGSANHTNELNRACTLAAFRPIAEMTGVSVYSLQKGPGSEQADSPFMGMDIKRLDKELDLAERFVDTAALMVNLDLVISIDTSIVHLAGALGCPVWTLLCASPDWRWGMAGSHSPWYPSMRLFRQSVSGNWDGVMANVRDELEVYVRRNTQ